MASTRHATVLLLSAALAPAAALAVAAPARAAGVAAPSAFARRASRSPLLQEAEAPPPAATAAPEEAPNQLESAGSMLVHNSHSTGIALALLAALAVALFLV